MILFIAITATLNLCVGYALGVYFGELPGLDLMPRRRPVDPPQADIDLLSSEVEEPAAEHPTVQEPAPSGPTPGPVPPAGPGKKPSKAQVLQGVAAFQSQLAKMGEEMKSAADDEQAFGECSDRLQKANHEYLEQAQSQMEELSADPEDSTASACRDVLEENTKLVADASEEIDSILADGTPDEEARAELMAKTETLTETVAEAEQKIEAVVEAEQPSDAGDAATPAEDAPKENAGSDLQADKLLDADSRLATLDSLQQAIDEAVDGADPVVIATVRRDPMETADADVESRVLAGLTEMVGEVLEETHLMAPLADDQLLVLLTGDTAEEASQRVERIRQQVEKTTFVADKDKHQVTVTCAVAESDEQVTREGLLEFAEEALGESKRHGANRSYHHDGRFPAPVIPEEIEVTARTVTV